MAKIIIKNFKIINNFSVFFVVNSALSSFFRIFDGSKVSPVALFVASLREHHRCENDIRCCVDEEVFCF